MIAVTFADLAFRARQFLIAVIGVALVLAMALLLSGLSHGFTYELEQTVGGFGATNWVLANGAHGRLTAVATFPQSEVTAIRGQPGVRQAQPLLILPSQSTQIDGQTVNVNLAGVVPGALGSPSVSNGNGHGLAGPLQVVVDTGLQAPVGSTIILGGRRLEVVGTVSNRTLLGGAPLIYLPLSTAQNIALVGQPLVTSVLMVGTPTRVPSGLEVLSPQMVVNASVGELKTAASSITNSTVLMWIIAAFIVAALLYVAALERRSDFAVLKALGASSAQLFGSLVIEAVIITLIAAAIAELASNEMTFLFQQPVVIQTSAYIQLPLISIVVGLLASVVALRRATGADPASAFG